MSPQNAGLFLGWLVGFGDSARTGHFSSPGHGPASLPLASLLNGSPHSAQPSFLSFQSFGWLCDYDPVETATAPSTCGFLCSGTRTCHVTLGRCCPSLEPQASHP